MITPSLTRPGSDASYSKQLQTGLKWHWSLEVDPASPPNQGIADSLDEAKAALVKRYDEIKRGNDGPQRP